MTVTTMTEDHLLMRMLASPAAVGLCRTLVAARLHRWGLRHAIADAELVTAELVANAVAATPQGGEIWIRCAHDATGVLLQIWDPNPRMPQPQPVDLTLETLDLDPEHADDNGGWGLTIIAALTLDHGCTPHPYGGKTAWARLKI